MYCSSENKIFSYTSTAVEPFLYFGEVKIAIYRDRTRICTWGGPKLKNKKKKIMQIKTNIYFIFNKILYTK